MSAGRSYFQLPLSRQQSDEFHGRMHVSYNINHRGLSPFSPSYFALGFTGLLLCERGIELPYFPLANLFKPGLGLFVLHRS
jgi:hypothetical protein